MILQYCKKINLFRKLKKEGFPWIKVHKDIIQKYKYTTNRNQKSSDFLIQFKINRSYYSGKLNTFNDYRNIVNYGQLKVIKDNEKNMIIDIHNSSYNINGRINFETKDKITSIYMRVFGGGEI